MESHVIEVERHYDIFNPEAAAAKVHPSYTPYTTGGNIPQELIDKILEYLDDGKLRRIHFNCKLPNAKNPAAKLWLTKPISLPVLLHINSSTRSNFLARYGPYSRFTGPHYRGFLIHPSRDIVVVSLKERLSSRGAQGEIFALEDLAKIENVGIDLSKIWATGDKHKMAVVQLAKIFSNLKILYLRGTFDGMDPFNYWYGMAGLSRRWLDAEAECGEEEVMAPFPERKDIRKLVL